MTLFIKRGTNKANHQPIYPRATQRYGIGNCAAVAGASCLYAMGLDQCSGLLPPIVPGGTPDSEAITRINAIVGELTQSIYQDGNSVAEAYQKYLAKHGCDGALEVTEFGADVDIAQPSGRPVPAPQHAINELRRCQDVIPFIKWDKGEKKDARHAVVVVGIDEETHEVVIGQHYGNDDHVPPSTADAAGTGNQGYPRYKYQRPADHTFTINYEGHRAEVYHFVTICPRSAPRSVSSTGGSTTPGPSPKAPITVTYQYDIRNTRKEVVNGFAVPLHGLEPRDIGRITSPPGWTVQFWFEGQERGFYERAPEYRRDPILPPPFLGLLWRSAEGLSPGKKSIRFAFEVYKTRYLTAARRSDIEQLARKLRRPLKSRIERWLKVLYAANTWRDAEGVVLLLHESETGTVARYEQVKVPEPYCDVPALLDLLIR